ncbi:MAG: hypothetical protein H5U04_01240 [Firmicutes bacterium]|nr:hypothetical protein [Bacillota bacterium]
MLEPETLRQVRELIARRAEEDRRVLDDLCREVRPLAGNVKPIRPRSTTAVSLVGSDGGNNRLLFDPFFMQFVRVVDSYGQEHHIECVSPTTDTEALSRAQFTPDGKPKTALGVMMTELGVDPPLLWNLSPMIPRASMIREHPEMVSPSWIQVYRDLCEWAVLYDRIRNHSFATDTLIVRDGMLRSKVFRGELFIRWRQKIEEAIERVWRTQRRRIYLVGIAKRSKVLERYRLALAIEGVMLRDEPCYVRVPREMEAKAFVWPEWARGPEAEGGEREAPKFVAGDMYFVRFGSRPGDPIWTIDVFSSQSESAGEIFGYLLADAIAGFPVPLYPRCLQKAHEYAQVTGFDLTILQDEIYQAVRDLLPPDKRGILDEARLHPEVGMGGAS